MLQDYEHELVCITEREKFVVPVKAIGARALLDFPDEIHFSAAPVKVGKPLPIKHQHAGIPGVVDLCSSHNSVLINKDDPCEECGQRRGKVSAGNPTVSCRMHSHFEQGT